MNEMNINFEFEDPLDWVIENTTFGQLKWVKFRGFYTVNFLEGGILKLEPETLKFFINSNRYFFPITETFFNLLMELILKNKE